MTPSAEIEPGPHWWKASALTTRPTLPPRREEGKAYIRHRRHLRKCERIEDIEPPPESPVPEVPEEANTARHVAKGVPSHGQQGESGPLPESGAAGTLATYPDTAYSTRSGRVPVRPAKFNNFIMN